jgi:hypothetical protein
VGKVLLLFICAVRLPLFSGPRESICGVVPTLACGYTSNACPSVLPSGETRSHPWCEHGGHAPLEGSEP